VKKSYVGSLSREGCLMLEISITSLNLMRAPLTLGRAFGDPMFPSEVSYFAWTATLGKIFTVDNLRIRRAIMFNWCCMCKKSGETGLSFLHCEITSALWSAIFSRL
jgi:hypothetical protein